MRVQSAQSAQPQESGATVSDSPILPQAPQPQQDSQPDPTAQPPPKPAAHQPSRFASEAAQQADISSSEVISPSPGQVDEPRANSLNEGPAAALVEGASDTLGQEGEQAIVPAQQRSSDLGLRQSGSFGSRAGHVPNQPQGPGQGFVEQPQDGRDGFDNDLGSGLSGVKQVRTVADVHA